MNFDRFLVLDGKTIWDLKYEKLVMFLLHLCQSGPRTPLFFSFTNCATSFIWTGFFSSTAAPPFVFQVSARSWMSPPLRQRVSHVRKKPKFYTVASIPQLWSRETAIKFWLTVPPCSNRNLGNKSYLKASHPWIPVPSSANWNQASTISSIAIATVCISHNQSWSSSDNASLPWTAIHLDHLQRR